jgi:hypothetical protein
LDIEIHEYFTKHPSNRKLATATIYNEGKSPDETCAELVKLIRGG